MEKYKGKIKVCCVASVDMTIRFMLFSQLKFLQKEGYEVYAVCSSGKWVKSIEDAGIKVKTIKIKRRISPLSDFIAFLKLFFYFKKEKFQIVHTHTIKAEFYGQIAAKLAGVPIIINTLHGFDFSENAYFLKKKLFILLEKISGRFSTTIFSISHKIINIAIKEKIFPQNLLKYLGRDIDSERFNPAKFSSGFITKKKKELGIDESKKVIGIIARLVEEKGYLDLFAAFKTVLKKFPNTLLLIIGPEEPEKKDAINPNIIKQCGIGNNVIFLGERTDIDELYSIMDIFVLPSRREGLGASILEASAMAKPVIACNIGGCSEAVDDGKTGILVPPEDPDKIAAAVTFFLENPEKAREMGRRGRKKVLVEFNQNLVFDRLKKEYLKLIKEHPYVQFEKWWLERYSKIAREEKEDYKILFSTKESIENYQRYFFEYFKNNIKKDNSKSRLLDSGCGLGTYSEIFAQKGFQVYGVDYTPEIIDVAKKRVNEKKINFLVADIYNLPFSDNFFNMIVCLSVLQYVSDVKNVLAEAKRVLKKDGTLAIITLNTFSLGRLFFKEKLVKYNPYKFKKELKKLGFKDIKIRGIYLSPFSSTNFLIKLINSLKIHKLFNIFFPIFIFFSHSFYIEARKNK